MGSARQAVPHQPAITDRLFDPLSPLRGLARPENLMHGPAGDRPHELILRRQFARGVAHVQGLVDHRSAVPLDDLAGQPGVADVEMRLEDDDHLLQFRFTARVRLLRFRTR